MGDFQDGYYLFDNDVNMMFRGSTGLGPVSELTSTGLAGAQQISVSDGAVACTYAGYAHSYIISTASLCSFTPDSTNPLKGIIFVSASSATAASVQALWGTAAAPIPAGLADKFTRVPIPPNIPTNSVLLAEVWVPANAANGAACTIFQYKDMCISGRTGAHYVDW